MTSEQLMILIRQAPQIIAEYILAKGDFETWGKARMDAQTKVVLESQVAAGKEAENKLAALTKEVEGGLEGIEG